MHTSCALSCCIWSDQMNFCATLKQAGVPLDEKWPLVILYLRGLKNNAMFSELQKAEMQNLLFVLLQKKDFSDAAYAETEQRIHAVITSPYTEKTREVTREISALIKDIYSMCGKHQGDLSAIADKVDRDMTVGVDPKLVLTDLRDALKDVMAKMAEDVSGLMTLSQSDSLTGIANRRRFDEFLQEAVESWTETGTPASLIMLDIDHFKNINDTFGHRVGDQVLQALAGQVKKVLRPFEDGGDAVLAARYGGDELAVVIRGEPALRATLLAEIIRKEAGIIAEVLSGEENGGGRGKRLLTVSAGVASMWEGWKGAYAANIVDFADTALYRAKSNGRNCTVRYSPESEDPYVIVS